MKKIEAVDRAAILRVADRLKRTRPTLAAIGPLSRLESYAEIAGRFV